MNLKKKKCECKMSLLRCYNKDDGYYYYCASCQEKIKSTKEDIEEPCKCERCECEEG